MIFQKVGNGVELEAYLIPLLVVPHQQRTKNTMVMIIHFINQLISIMVMMFMIHLIMSQPQDMKQVDHCQKILF